MEENTANMDPKEIKEVKHEDFYQRGNTELKRRLFVVGQHCTAYGQYMQAVTELNSAQMSKNYCEDTLKEIGDSNPAIKPRCNEERELIERVKQLNEEIESYTQIADELKTNQLPNLTLENREAYERDMIVRNESNRFVVDFITSNPTLNAFGYKRETVERMMRFPSKIQEAIGQLNDAQVKSLMAEEKRILEYKTQEK